MYNNNDLFITLSMYLYQPKKDSCAVSISSKPIVLKYSGLLVFN